MEQGQGQNWEEPMSSRAQTGIRSMSLDSGPTTKWSGSLLGGYESQDIIRRDVEATADYIAEDEEELSFKKGDRIEVRETDQANWAFGIRKKGGRGWFPLDKVKAVDGVKRADSHGMIVDASSIVSQRSHSTESLQKRLSSRPTRQELQDANILPSSEASPSLLATQKSLERKKKSDFLSSFFRLKKDPKKDKKDSLEVSKKSFNFGGKECTFDDVVEDEFVIKNVGSSKMKWVLEFESYNQPFVLTFVPNFGSLPKGKTQLVKAKLLVKTLATKELAVKLQHPKGEIYTELVMKLKCRQGVFGSDPSSLPLVRDNGFMVPSVLAQMRAYLVKHEGFEKEGIFRLSGDMTEIQALKRQIDETKKFGGSKDTYSIANLIKIFYRDLPDPIFQNVPRETLYSEDPAICSKAVEQLPEPKLSLLKWLISIIYEVTKHSKINKMTVDNLAIVIAPNLYKLGKEVDPMEGLMISQRSAKFFGVVINDMIDSGKVSKPKETAPPVELRSSPVMIHPNRRRSQSLNAIQQESLGMLPVQPERRVKSPTMSSSVGPAFGSVRHEGLKPALPGMPKPILQPKPLLRRPTLGSLPSLNTFPGPRRNIPDKPSPPGTPPGSPRSMLRGVPVLPHTYTRQNT